MFMILNSTHKVKKLSENYITIKFKIVNLYKNNINFKVIRMQSAIISI